MLVKLLDGGIINITDDKDYYSGCETCDYGSSYSNYYEFEMTKCSFVIEINQMYGYALSDGDIMNIILPNIDEIRQLTEDGFVDWVDDKILSRVGVRAKITTKLKNKEEN